MALQSPESCSNGDFQLGFGASINFKPAFEREVHSPPDSRKRMAQHDKGPAESIEETFVQPEPPKKHKATFSTNVSTFSFSRFVCLFSFSPKYNVAINNLLKPTEYI